MKWFTCTPVEFGGGPDFFARDSGLMSRAFRMLGVGSCAVMPGAPRPDDDEGLIRTAYADLEDPEWWRSLGIDGLVLYAWGSPKFRHVAAAVRRAGIRLVLNQDNGGLVSPVLGLPDWTREQWMLSGAGRVPGGVARFALLVAKGLSKGLLWDDPMRAWHLAQGDVIACVTPLAVRCHQSFCRIYGGDGLADRVRLLPHPVHPRFLPADGAAPRPRRIVTVGRWDDERQKRTRLMTGVMTELLRTDPMVEVAIVGGGGEALDAWRGALPPECAGRVRLHGRMRPEDLVDVYRRSQVLYCPSAFESFHIAGGEALCCGCSVVAARSPSLAAFPWFTGDGSGSLADTDDGAGHVAALRRELALWEADGGRGAGISACWSERLHADRIAGRILREFGMTDPPETAGGSGIATPG